MFHLFSQTSVLSGDPSVPVLPEDPGFGRNSLCCVPKLPGVRSQANGRELCEPVQELFVPSPRDAGDWDQTAGQGFPAQCLSRWHHLTQDF